MEKQKFLRIILTTSASVLLSILVVFVVVNAQSYLRQDALVVEGTAEIRSSTEIFGGAYLNTAGLADSTGLVVKERVGIGNKFFGPTGVPPVYDLDVDGTVNAEWIRASGGRFDTVIIDSGFLASCQVCIRWTDGDRNFDDFSESKKNSTACDSLATDGPSAASFIDFDGDVDGNDRMWVWLQCGSVGGPVPTGGNGSNEE